MNMGYWCVLFFIEFLRYFLGRGRSWGRDSSEGWLSAREGQREGERERPAVRGGGDGAVRWGGS